MEQRTDFQEKDTIFHQIFEESRIGQVILDNKFHLISINKRMFEYFGLKTHFNKNMLFGQVFHCSHLGYLCSGCGKGGSNRCDFMHGTKIIQTYGKIDIETICFPFLRNDIEEVKWFQLNGFSVYYMEQRYILLSFTDITELKQKEKRLKQLLSLDLATGTMNKYSLRKAIKKRVRENTIGQFSLCMIDFDNFKQFNDHYGHLIGDKALEKFSDIAHKQLRKGDVLGRYGGEEFVFLFDELDENQSFQILNRIHKELTLYFDGTTNHPVTFSAGIVTINSNNETINDEVVLCRADALLYEAKGLGRSRAMSSQGEWLFAAY